MLLGIILVSIVAGAILTISICMAAGRADRMEEQMDLEAKNKPF